MYKQTGAMLIRSQNVYDDGLRLDDVARFDYSLYETRGSHVLPNDILLNITGASIGRCAIVPPVFEDADVNQHVLILRQIDAASLAYVHLVITSPVVQMAIMNVQVGATKEGLSATKASDLLIPMAPLEEQRRIVDRVDSLLTHVDEYGSLESTRERLDAELPDKLRKSILQLAVQGKLVEQDPSDESASVLLDRIRAERAALVKAKKIKAPKGGESVIYRASDGGYYEKRGKGEPVCIDDEIPFEIPESWEWVRLGSLFDMQAGKNIAAPKIADTKDEQHPYACFGGNGIRGYVQAPNRCGRHPIIGRQGALCGCINYAEGEFYATEHAVVTTCFDKTDVDWACIFLEALNLNQYATATAQPGLAVSKIAEVLIPLPPTNEQCRIANTYSSYFSFTNR